MSDEMIEGVVYVAANGTLEPIDHIDRWKMKVDNKKLNARKVELYRTLLRHIIGALCAVAELHLGYKIDIKG